MSKLYIYGIGGTGARVLRSLTMLLASGVSLGKDIDTIVPVIVDPDTSNGDLTRTVGLMQLYQKIRSHLSFDNRREKRGYFFTQIDDMGTNFRLHLNNVANMRFGDYIAYNRFTSEGHADPNQALFSLLFSDSNLNCPLDVGFKGNPNMGAIVLNDPMNTESLVSLLQNFQSGDKLFIISSIFGGTGAAGFPLFQKTFREAEKLDMNVWIYDENSYPTGFAGGLVPEAMPESRGKGLSVFRRDALTDAIIPHIKKEYGVLIGRGMAEDVKKTIGSAIPKVQDEYMEVRGRDLYTGLPKNIQVDAISWLSQKREPATGNIC